MRIIGSSFRRGTSTVFGVLIFVGIMFTAVIPMFLVMNQADIFYERAKFEVGRVDEERVSEDVYFYVSPSFEEGDPSLTLKVNNRGEHAVKIIRVWINDTLEDINCIIPPISNIDLGPFTDLIVPDPLKPTTYQIVAVTDRGNIISPISGNPIYNSVIDEWTMNYFTIYIMMSQPTNSLHILVEREIDPEGSEIIVDDDVLSFRSIYPISVLEEGTYHVTVYRHYGQTSVETLLEAEVVLDLLKTSDVVWVPA